MSPQPVQGQPVPAPAHRWVPVARAWNTALVLVVLASMVAQLTLVVRGENVLVDAAGHVPPVGTRVIRFFSYFTIQSNVLVAVTCAWLVVDPRGRSRLWQVLRLDAIVGISVTGLIYVTLLRPLVDLSGVPKLTDIGFHYVVPVGAVVGWLLFGPRGRIGEGLLGWSLVWPVLYIGYTLAHGAAGHWYPYPFVDVNVLGYPVALRNGVGVALLILGIGLLFRWADRLLIRLPAGPSDGPRRGRRAPVVPASPRPARLREG